MPAQGQDTINDLRRTISAILWRNQNAAKWRVLLSDLDLWSRAAQALTAGPMLVSGNGC